MAIGNSAKKRDAGHLTSQRPQKIVNFSQLSDNEQDDVKHKNLLPNSQPSPLSSKGKAAHDLAESRKKLPVWKPRKKIISEIEQNDTVVVLGETGSGKSTQIPQFLLHSSCPKKHPSIAITQPRRVAATTLAARVATEAGCRLGTTVGYSVRFDDMSSQKTRLKYLTDGTLLQELLSDPMLLAYDVVILDEAHERSLRTDMLLGFLKKVQRQRKDQGRTLKVIVMSATLDAQKFSQFFDDAKIIYIQGRQHPVTVHYCTEPQSDFIESTLKTIMDIHINRPPNGDILVFLTGQDDIENLQASIQHYSQELPILYPKAQMLETCPLYASLGPVQQAKAFAPAPKGARKVILATNVAETSVTIPGICYVIDTGLSKQKDFKPGSGVESLLVQPISRSSARQRSGRAGRERPGHCFRLYTKETFDSLQEASIPEIQRVSLSFAILHLIATGYDEVQEFDFIDPPGRDAIIAALKNLWGLGCIDNSKKITSLGKKMASLPLEPTFSKILLASFELNCASQVIDLVSIISHLDKLFINNAAAREQAGEARQKFVHRDGDHLTYLNILKAYDEITNPSERTDFCKQHFLSKRSLSNIDDTRKQLRQRCLRLGLDYEQHSSEIGNSASIDGSSSQNDERILECVFAGLFENTALRKPDGTFQNVKSRVEIKIHPSSTLHGKPVSAIVYNELVFTSATYARCVSSIRPSWLQDKSPMYSQKSDAALK